jgi:hypothetical protein
MGTLEGAFKLLPSKILDVLSIKKMRQEIVNSGTPEE